MEVSGALNCIGRYGPLQDYCRYFAATINPIENNFSRDYQKKRNKGIVVVEKKKRRRKEGGRERKRGLRKYLIGLSLLVAGEIGEPSLL